MAHWALFDKVLTPTEISNVYNAGIGYLAGAVGVSQCQIGTPSEDIDEYVYELFDLVRDRYQGYPA